MAKRTNKAGTSGRFGARYGVVIRNRVKTIEAEQKKSHECPVCHSKDIDYMTRIIGYLKRVSNFSMPRQQEAGRRFYAGQSMLDAESKAEA